MCQNESGVEYISALCGISHASSSKLDAISMLKTYEIIDCDHIAKVFPPVSFQREVEHYDVLLIN